MRGGRSEVGIEEFAKGRMTEIYLGTERDYDGGIAVISAAANELTVNMSGASISGNSRMGVIPNCWRDPKGVPIAIDGDLEHARHISRSRRYDLWESKRSR